MSRRNRRKRRRAGIPNGEAIKSETPDTQSVRSASDPPTQSHPSQDSSCDYALPDEAYFQERTMLIEMEQRGADQHDKAILTLTAGALGLSLTFIEKIAPNPTPETHWLIGSAWLAFIVSIVTILLSFLTSQLACRRQRDLLDKERSHGIRPEEVNRWADITLWLNFAAYTCFVAGVAFLAAFSWSNLQR